jgi:uncharacterized membrane protein
MEDFVANIAFPSLLCGVDYILMGVIMYYYPPKEINSLYGYRTGSSMKSQERWDFAQRFCAILAMKISVVMIIVSLLAYLVPADTDIKQISGVFLLILGTVHLLYSTETAIKQRFK